MAPPAPPLSVAMRATASRIIRNGARTFTARTLSRVAVVTLSILPIGPGVPALLTSAVIGPNAASTVRYSARIESSSAISAATAMALPPDAAISATTASAIALLDW